MASITLGGNAISTVGELPQKGDKAPAFALTGADLKPVTSDDLTGKKVVLNIFPSVDTGVCATSVRTFNEKAAELEDTAVVCVSADLPFAFKRFCGAEGIDNVAVGSTFRNPEFLDDFGVRIIPDSSCSSSAIAAAMSMSGSDSCALSKSAMASLYSSQPGTFCSWLGTSV